MGELARALRDPRTRSRLRTDGGNYTYDNPLELAEDMAALKRAFPEVRLLANDSPLDHAIGYIGYRTENGQEVVFYFRLYFDRLQAWENGSLTGTQAALAQCFRTAEGRRRIVQVVEEVARRPELQSEEIAAPRRSVWERLVDDDEPL